MKILSPFKIKNVLFSNRVVMAPMVVFGMQSVDGVMGKPLIDHYVKRAETGMGLVISQALSVTGRTPPPNMAGAYSPEHADYLSRIAAACHANGARFFAQLAYPTVGHRGGDSINSLLPDEIKTVEAEYIQAAKIAMDAGCDGIELHGAHTYFLNMFTSRVANQRADEYGHGHEGGMRLSGNIIAGIREFADENFIVGYRMGVCGRHEADALSAKALEAAGVDLLHISSGVMEDEADLNPPVNLDCSHTAWAGCRAQRAVSIPVIAVEDFRSLDRGNNILERGLCAMIAYGKPFLADWRFMEKSREDPAYQPCLRCRVCQWHTDGQKCPAVLLREQKEI